MRKFRVVLAGLFVCGCAPMVPPNTASYATGRDGLARVVRPVGSPGQAIIAGACPPTIDAAAMACGAAAFSPASIERPEPVPAPTATLHAATAARVKAFMATKPGAPIDKATLKWLVDATPIVSAAAAEFGKLGSANPVSPPSITTRSADPVAPTLVPPSPEVTPHRTVAATDPDLPMIPTVPAPTLAAVSPDPRVPAVVAAGGEIVLDRASAGIDKVQRMFAPKRKTVFGKTLLAGDGLPAVPALAESTRDGERTDPVMLPAELAWLAPALGGAAVGPGTPSGDIPPSAFVALESAVTSSAPAGPPGRLGMPTPVDAIMGRSWQPMPDEPIGTTSAGPPGDASTARRASASYTTTAPRPAIRSGRYLVIGSFLTFRHAERLAARHRGIAAVVIPTVIDGKTWHRVAVPEPTRGRLSGAGITDFWVLGR